MHLTAPMPLSHQQVLNEDALLQAIQGVLGERARGEKLVVVPPVGGWVGRFLAGWHGFPAACKVVGFLQVKPVDQG